MALALKMSDDFCFKFQPGMITANVNLHRATFSNKNKNRWHFYQRFLYEGGEK
jgi:hypothetical protein